MGEAYVVDLEMVLARTAIVEAIRERDEARAEVARVARRLQRFEEALAAICQWPHPVSDIALKALQEEAPF